MVRLAVAAGVDAVLVQDLGLLRLIGRLCPELPLHASTQMTLSSSECIEEVASLGVRRVVLPRELSIPQIAAIRRQTGIELEAFVHGALCISYSGQCLASLTFGGRSGNRGQCAQPCRLPYEVICDGRPLDSGAMRYPLSPHNLAAYDRLPELIAAGVSALKIEGRLKPAEYVAAVTRHYRAAIDAACPHPNPLPRGEGTSVAEMELAFSRGFCHGWLDGPQDRSLISGTSWAKCGTHLGEVRAVRGGRVAIRLAGPVQRGDGVVFEGDRAEGTETGGRVYEIFQDGRPLKRAAAGGLVELAFRRGTVEAGNVRPGQGVWKTDDPQAARRLRRSYAAGRPYRRVPVDVAVEAAVGSVLRVTATTATGAACRLESAEALAEAVKHPLRAETLVEQFGRLGNTPYQLRRLELKLDGRVMVPLSVLGTLRREMVRQLQAAAAQPPPRDVAEESPLAALRAEGSGFRVQGSDAQNQRSSIRNQKSEVPYPSSFIPRLHVLCRSMEQIEAALSCGITSVIADFQDLERCGDAVRAAHAAQATILLATPRIHKPGESICPPLPLGEGHQNVSPLLSGEGQGVRASTVFELLAAHRPDGLLVRNLAGLGFCRRSGLPAVADFSLNAANDLTVRWLHDQGAGRVTAAYDLGRRQLLDLAAAVPPEWLEVVVHRHTPLFHAEYCLFCRTLSQGSNRTECGRPCRRHTLRLRDRLGVEHPVVADSQCRNTVFHGDAESLADAVPALRERGVRHFRVELATKGAPEEVRCVLAAQQRLIGG